MTAHGVSMSDKPLKLKAKDAEDLQVVSAVLQDSIAPVCDMAFRPGEKDFVMVVQRFCCEDAEPGACPERVRCAVHVTGVASAQIQGLDLDRREDMLELLAVMPEDAAVAVATAQAGAEQSPHKSLQFVFAGGGKIRLALGDWSLIIEDFGERWPVAHQPCHEEGTAVGIRHSGKTRNPM
ncbi:MAG TPA: DUF2948 family protein [Alphaproteobacteria bacterium]|nr:DUF2948 family protein [Alphaproteobacteria bacterium]